MKAAEPVARRAAHVETPRGGADVHFAHRVSSADAERSKSRICAIRVPARGYRNRENFKTVIWLHLGGLQLYPVTPSSPLTPKSALQEGKVMARLRAARAAASPDEAVRNA